jgi:hypothetical protein
MAQVLRSLDVSIVINGESTRCISFVFYVPDPYPYRTSQIIKSAYPHRFSASVTTEDGMEICGTGYRMTRDVREDGKLETRYVFDEWTITRQLVDKRSTVLTG